MQCALPQYQTSQGSSTSVSGLDALDLSLNSSCAKLDAAVQAPFISERACQTKAAETVTSTTQGRLKLVQNE